MTPSGHGLLRDAARIFSSQKTGGDEYFISILMPVYAKRRESGRWNLEVVEMKSESNEV